MRDSKDQEERPCHLSCPHLREVNAEMEMEKGYSAYFAERNSLKPYGYYEGKCPKCEGKLLFKAYRDEVRPYRSDVPYPHCVYQVEKLEYTCAKCGATVSTKPKDAL